MKVAGLQLRLIDATTRQQKESNVDHILQQIDACPQCDLIVVPELATVGYGQDVFENLSFTADPVASSTIDRIRSAAKRKQTFLAFGFPEKSEDAFYNSVALIDDRGGLIDVYRKTHLPLFVDTMEGDYFQSGDRLVSFDVRGVEVGVSICYDIRYPELARNLALDRNIDLLLHPTAFSDDETFASWHPFIVTRAIENQIYVLSVNRAGERSGRSFFCPPLMDWQRHSSALGVDEDCLVATIDDGVLSTVRQKYRYREGINQKALESLR